MKANVVVMETIVRSKMIEDKLQLLHLNFIFYFLKFIIFIVYIKFGMK